MSRIIKGVIIGVVILTLIDAGFMIKYIITHAELISKASFARFITFVMTHFYFIFMMGVLYQMDDNELQDIKIYRYSEWLVNTFVPVAGIDTFIEVGLFILMGTHKVIRTSTVSDQLKDQQLHLINFYFMTYMYATIIGVLGSIHLCVNRFLEKMQKNKYLDLVNQIMDKFLVEFNPNDPKLKQAECSICQLQFLQPQQTTQNHKIPLVNLQCHHLFHQDCILEWVKKTYQESMPAKCPNCRRIINS